MDWRKTPDSRVGLPRPASLLDDLPSRFSPPPLGRILVSMGELSPENLEAALARQRSQFLKGRRLSPIGGILVKSKLVPRYLVDAALTTQRRRLDLARQAWRLGVRLGELSARAMLEPLKQELPLALATRQGEWDTRVLRDGYTAAGGRPEHWQIVAAGAPAPAASRAAWSRRPPVDRQGAAHRKSGGVQGQTIEAGGIAVEVYSLSGAVEFDRVSAVKHKALRPDRSVPVVIDLSGAMSISIAAAGTLADTVHKLLGEDVPVAVVLPELMPSPSASILTAIPAGSWFVSIEEALTAVRQRAGA